ncbi:MAG: hypothetical protein AAFN93_06855 [Bacteroidota bacterium]
MTKTLILTALLITFTAAKEKLVKTKVTENITVSLPKSFFEMTPSDIAQRYPSVRKPIGAYTNEERLVDFSINVSATQWRSTDVKIAKDFFKASIVNLYDRVDFINEEIKTIGDREFIVFEFDSRINGNARSLEGTGPVRGYSYVQYLISKGKTIVFSFNCPIQRKEAWQATAKEVMNSIKVKGKI